MYRDKDLKNSIIKLLISNANLGSRPNVRYPNGCGKDCNCVHPADDCAFEDCQRRHSYRLLKSHIMNKLITIRLNFIRLNIF